jgi:hypothetical protein
MRGGWLAAGFACLAAATAAGFACLAAATAAGEEPFRVHELAAPGRIGTAGFADLDGDGRNDVYLVSLIGVPPEARRELRIHFQEPDGTLPLAPGLAFAVDAGAAAFDVADLPDGPGEEILLLLRHQLRVLSFAGRVRRQRDIEIPGEPTVATAPDERGLDRLHMARDGLGSGLRLLVPGFGDCAILTPEGELKGRLDVGQRANYFIPPRPGPVVGESELETYYDYPRLELGEVNGDGRADLLSATRHEVRVFLQREDGGFDTQPSRQLPLRRLSEKDQIRGSGNVRVVPQDLDDDGRVDLMVIATTGGLLDTRTETTFHLNRKGSWDLERADQRLVVEGAWTTLQILDVDGDGHLELVEARVPLSILQMVEVLLTRSVDVEARFYRASSEAVFQSEPFLVRQLGVPVEFETFGPTGFFPTVVADMNGDGIQDRVESSGGEAFEVYLGGGERPYAERSARQDMDTRSSIRFGDLDADGLSDFLIFDRRRIGAPLRLGVNRGVLPRTRTIPSLTAPEGDGGSE